METKIVNRTKREFTVEVTIPYSKSMLEFEKAIQKKVNEVGTIATGEALEKFDTDGGHIVIGGKKWTSKGKIPKPYQTPYGEVTIERHVYQSSFGGKIYCPLERDARIIITSTPRFGKMLSSKYAEFGSGRVIKDLEENHGRQVARSFVQNVCEVIGTVATVKEEDWEYELPEMGKDIKSITVGLDGACMLMAEDGYRHAMVGTLGFYDKQGERQHTIYIATTPEYGKSSFLSKLENEVYRVKELYPCAKYVGLADGAKDNWGFLSSHTEVQTLDFWHATGYLAKAAGVMFKGKTKIKEREDWMDKSCHKLKHKHGSASRVLNEMERYRAKNKLSVDDSNEISSAISYLKNNKKRMNYAQNIASNLPIGSGITEAACKVIIKQRLCSSGMRWKDQGASTVLSLRCLNYTENRWGQFWDKIDQFGFPLAA